MKRSSRNKASNIKLSRKQRSTLEMWQDHLAALSRASEPKPEAIEQRARFMSEHSVEPESRPSFLA